MAGTSPSPVDLAAGRGRGPSPPPWMHGPIMPNVPGQPPPLQHSISSTPMHPNMPVLGVSATSVTAVAPPEYASTMFRPMPASLHPNSAFVQFNTQHFRPVNPSPNIPLSLPIQQVNMPGVGPPTISTMQVQTTQYPQQIPLPGGTIQVPQVNLPPIGAVRSTPPPSFTYMTQNNSGMRPPIPTSGGQIQAQPPSMMQPWSSTQMTASGALQTGQTGQQTSFSVNSVLVQTESDWQEHSAPDGRRYYYNKKTKQSSWEKPLELMTLLERADASTVWKEFTAADGRKYYYNKVTRQSRWTIPEELKIAREQTQIPDKPLSTAPEATVILPNASTSSALSSPSMSVSGKATTASSKPSESEIKETSPKADAEPDQHDASTASAGKETEGEKEESVGKSEAECISENKGDTLEGHLLQSAEEERKSMPSAGHFNANSNDDKPLPASEEAMAYANKAEAKAAFRELLESVHVASDWTWEQAMRLIINDKRYGVLKSLTERKQAFSEFLALRKKQEVEEKRVRLKKAREEFIIMLQESKELSSRMRWSKVVSLLGEDPRFRAVERDREREELFEDYIIELEAKEKERAREERKRNLAEYRKYLESCEFIKVNTQWRKAAEKLEEDERCSRLVKSDRLDVFQEYIRDLEKAHEEEIKILKEQQRRKERKNRDDFRELLNEHRASGLLNARATWRDYTMRVKDHPVYAAVSSNTSGTTPKELFDDVLDDIIKQYSEDKLRVRDFLKLTKVNLTSKWTLEDFRAAINGADGLSNITELNVKFIFEDVLDRAKEKEEKEAKMRKRAVDDFNELLRLDKSIVASSVWEDCKSVLSNTSQYRNIDDEAICRKLFNEYVLHLQQKAKERERQREEMERREKDKDKHKGKERERKDKDGEKDKSVRKGKESHTKAIEVENSDVDKEKQKERHGEKSKHRDKKHKRHHQHRSNDDLNAERALKDESKQPRKHSSEKRKSSRKHGHEQGSDGEHKHKRYHRDLDCENGRATALEDGELVGDGEHS